MRWVSKVTGGDMGSRELFLEFSLSQQVCLNINGNDPELRGKKKLKMEDRGDNYLKNALE